MSIGIHLLVSIIIIGVMYMLYNKLNKKNIILEKKINNIALLVKTNRDLNYTETFEPNTEPFENKPLRNNIPDNRTPEPINIPSNISRSRDAVKATLNDDILGKFKQKTTDINDLQTEINNIQNMLSDSSEESEILNADEYKKNLNLEIEPVDNNLINQVNNNILQENNSELENEYDHLLYKEPPNNSELGLMLNNDIDKIEKLPQENKNIESSVINNEIPVHNLDNSNPVSENDSPLVNKNNESLESIHLEISKHIKLEENIQSNENNIENNHENNISSLTLSSEVKKISGTDSKDIEIDVLVNTYTKKQLAQFCEEVSISKRGAKKQLVERLQENNFEFKDTNNTLEK